MSLSITVHPASEQILPGFHSDSPGFVTAKDAYEGTELPRDFGKAIF